MFAVQLAQLQHLYTYYAAAMGVSVYCLNLPCSEPTNGAEVVAARLEQVARGDAATAPKVNPMTRLRDTVVFGYLMATPKHGRVDVPDW
jgi:hypothetical protein